MNMNEVRAKAKAAGVKAARMRKAEVIRNIQLKEGNQDCYGADWRFECAETDCCWRPDCQTPSAR